jgi:hypothetical protein
MFTRGHSHKLMTNCYMDDNRQRGKQPITPLTHDRLITKPCALLQLTTIESHLLDPGSLTQVEKYASIHIEALCGQVDAALDGAAFVVGSPHVDKEQSPGRKVR